MFDSIILYVQSTHSRTEIRGDNRIENGVEWMSNDIARGVTGLVATPLAPRLSGETVPYERKYYCRALSIITVGSLTEWPLKWNWHLLDGIAVAPDRLQSEWTNTRGRKIALRFIRYLCTGQSGNRCYPASNSTTGWIITVQPGRFAAGQLPLRVAAALPSHRRLHLCYRVARRTP